jgi:hypothetical protein
VDEDQLVKREQELREQYPAMFSHPECRSGEVWIGDQLCDVAVINVHIYKTLGMSSARADSKKPVMGKLKGHDEEFEFWPIFVNLREFILAEEAHKQKDQQPVA